LQVGIQIDVVRVVAALVVAAARKVSHGQAQLRRGGLFSHVAGLDRRSGMFGFGHGGSVEGKQDAKRERRG
jgi:hypothetical protein